jgi:FkbM family methyltransferase
MTRTVSKSWVEMRRIIGRRPHWLLWHPHQRLWNWSLVDLVNAVVPEGRFRVLLVQSIIQVDSFLLALTVLVRRVIVLGIRPLKGSSEARRPKMLYIDCGVHVRGEQIRYMHRWFADRYDIETLGFEASTERFPEAEAALADLPQIHLLNVALVGPAYDETDVRLYKTGGEGKGDSLFAKRGKRYEVVPAQRLSDLLINMGDDLDRMPIILRMNIEGAELYVLEDLVASGLVGKIDGFYGMWDDLSKIDRNLDRHFRRLMRTEGIKTMTFNDRDLGLSLRRFAIRTDIDTRVRHALRIKSRTLAS